MNSDPIDSPVVVVGGGVSGLTAAHRLMELGRRVLVLDRREAAGGRIYSEHRAGFLVEHGPNSMIAPAPGAETLIDALGLAPELVTKDDAVRHRYLVRDGRTHALPIDPLGFFSSGFFSLRGRLRLLAEPFVSRGPDDESVASFVRRRFGHELLDYVFDPLVGGLYAGDPEKLSLRALLPRLKQLEERYGSVIRGVATKALSGIDARYDPRRRQIFSFRDGMATLPSRLAAALGPRLRSGTRVEGLHPAPGGGYRLRLRQRDGFATLHARQIVIALPAYAAARLIDPLSCDAAAALAGIEHPPLAVVALGYRRRDLDHPLDGLGVLTPRVEHRNVLGLLFSSTLFPDRAPESHALVTAYVGGARQPELARLPRDELIALVRTEIGDLLGGHGEPVFDSLRYWQHALPQPALGHAQRIAALNNVEREWPGIAFAGNYIDGVSTTACIEAARTAAARICAQRPSRHRTWTAA